MTPEQRLIAKWTFYLLFLLGVFFSGYAVRGHLASYADTKARLAQERTTNAVLTQQAADLRALALQNHSLQSKLTQLNDANAQTLKVASDENTRLRTDLAVARRMSLNGTYCPQAAAPGAATATGSLGQRTPVELSAETRHLVFDLRTDLIHDQAKLIYYQRDYVPWLLQWIDQQCMKKAPD